LVSGEFKSEANTRLLFKSAKMNLIEKQNNLQQVLTELKQAEEQVRERAQY